MIFTLGCYHADPHPGNLVLLPGNVIGLLDAVPMIAVGLAMYVMFAVVGG